MPGDLVKHACENAEDWCSLYTYNGGRASVSGWLRGSDTAIVITVALATNQVFIMTSKQELGWCLQHYVKRLDR